MLSPRVEILCQSSFLLVLACAVSGCGEQRKGAPKFPVIGTVLVNGKPAERVIARLYAVSDHLKGKDRTPYGYSDADGKIAFATFRRDDGMPAGEFVATFFWPHGPIPSMSDRLRGKYSPKTESNIRVFVDENTTELEPFELEVPPEWLTPSSENFSL